MCEHIVLDMKYTYNLKCNILYLQFMCERIAAYKTHAARTPMCESASYIKYTTYNLTCNILYLQHCAKYIQEFISSPWHWTQRRRYQASCYVARRIYAIDQRTHDGAEIYHVRHMLDREALVLVFNPYMMQRPLANTCNNFQRALWQNARSYEPQLTYCVLIH